MSILLPHFLKEGRGRLDTYFSRVYNPIWTNPDGFTLAGGAHRRGRWSAATWPSPRRGRRRPGSPTTCCRWAWAPSATTSPATRPTPAGGSGSASRRCVATPSSSEGRAVAPRRSQSSTRARCGRRTSSGSTCRGASIPTARSASASWFECDRRTPARRSASTSTTSTLFADSVPGLAEAAAAAGLSPLEYMRDRRRFALPGDQLRAARRGWSHRCGARGLRAATSTACTASRAPRARGSATPAGSADITLAPLGDGSPAVEVDGVACEVGFPTPSTKLELYSHDPARTGGGPSTPPRRWIPSPRPLGGHRLRRRRAHPAADVPHPHADPHPLGATRKWLNEISHRHPLWIHPSDAEKLGIEENGLVRITHPHRALRDPGLAHRGHPARRGGRLAPHGPLAARRRTRPARGAAGKASLITDDGTGDWKLRRDHGIQPYALAPTPTPERIWWSDTGVHQNLTFAVQPDPISGMQCWHQRVRVGPAAGRRPVRRRRGRHGQSQRGLPGVAGQDPPAHRRAAPAAVVRPAGEAGPRGLSAHELTGERQDAVDEVRRDPHHVTGRLHPEAPGR